MSSFLRSKSIPNNFDPYRSTTDSDISRSDSEISIIDSEEQVSEPRVS